MAGPCLCLLDSKASARLELPPPSIVLPRGFPACLRRGCSLKTSTRSSNGRLEADGGLSWRSYLVLAKPIAPFPASRPLYSTVVVHALHRPTVSYYHTSVELRDLMSRKL